MGTTTLSDSGARNLTQLARQEGVSLAALLRANPGVDPNIVGHGQRLKIPSKYESDSQSRESQARNLARVFYDEKGQPRTLASGAPAAIDRPGGETYAALPTTGTVSAAPTTAAQARVLVAPTGRPIGGAMFDPQTVASLGYATPVGARTTAAASPGGRPLSYATVGGAASGDSGGFSQSVYDRYVSAGFTPQQALLASGGVAQTPTFAQQAAASAGPLVMGGQPSWIQQAAAMAGPRAVQAGGLGRQAAALAGPLYAGGGQTLAQQASAIAGPLGVPAGGTWSQRAAILAGRGPAEQAAAGSAAVVPPGQSTEAQQMEYAMAEADWSAGRLNQNRPAFRAMESVAQINKFIRTGNQMDRPLVVQDYTVNSEAMRVYLSELGYTDVNKFLTDMGYRQIPNSDSWLRYKPMAGGGVIGGGGGGGGGGGAASYSGAGGGGGAASYSGAGSRGGFNPLYIWRIKYTA